MRTNHINMELINKQLTDNIVFSSSVFVAVALIGSLSRIPSLGFMPIMYFHLAICGAFVCVYFFRKKLSTSFKAQFVSYSYFVIGVTGIHTFGLSAAGVFFIFASAIISSLVINIRVALSLASLGFICLVTYFCLLKYTNFTFQVPTGEYNESSSSWFLLISSYAYLCAVSLFLIHRFFSYLKHLLANQQSDLNEQAKQLDHTNTIIHTIIDSLPFEIVWKDSSLNYLGANTRFISNIQHKIADNKRCVIEGKSDKDFFDRKLAESFEKEELRLLHGEHKIDVYERVSKNDKGKTTYKEVKKVALKDCNQNIIGVLVVINDITHLKTLELKASAANESKSKFLSTMSHEIRTPLNGLIGLLDLCIVTSDGDKKASYLNKAYKSAILLNQLTNNLLDFSKLESNQLRLESIPFNFYDILEHVVSLLEGQAQQKGIILSASFEGDKALELIGDPTRLMQIMINLTSNAIKFTPSGQVTIAVSQKELEDKAAIVLSVTDTGIGIHKDKLEHVFKDFAQADGTITRRFGGTGLGLSIVKSLAEQMHGKISLKSELKKGSEFTLELLLPVNDEEINALASEVTKAEIPTNKKQILLVEDNEINQEIAKEMLEQASFDVVTANDGQHAIDLLNTQAFDFIFMDIQMPIMDGVTATKLIRQNKKWQNIPIVALTANAGSNESAEYLKNGFTAHVAKPFNRDTLLSVVLMHTNCSKELSLTS